VTVTRLNAFGARVDGIDFGDGTTALQNGDLATIEKALYDYGVICVTAVAMSPAQHLALARHFGTPEHHTFFPNLGAGLETVTLLDSERDRSNMWHADESFLEHPPIITMTHAQQLPGYGGDTLFIDLHAAHDALSPQMKTYVADLTVMHDLAMIAEHSWARGGGDADRLIQMLQSGKRARHPLVVMHPHNGRKAVWVNETYTRHIEGLQALEAKTLLQFMYQHVQKPEFQYRHRWQVGDLLIWDNRSVLHYAAFDYTDRRIMHRVSVLASCGL